MRVLLFTFVFLTFQVDAAGKGAASYGSVPAASGATVSSSSSRGGGSSGTRSPLSRKAPPLAADRKIHEQDCTKPIDWNSGNLRCR